MLFYTNPCSRFVFPRNMVQYKELEHYGKTYFFNRS